ncbi:unnamed protein product, partial [Mesorhabditis belari]|uniref:Uncharacterized protein n=1 Tax=Mesorhabditis belari TaxID=2138241 RepID=A0AAF3FAX9_9BILA
YKLLKETHHLEFQKSLVILRSQVAALTSDETSSQARSSHTDLRIPSMLQQRNHASASQNGAIIYGVRPTVNVPSAARFARSRHHQNLAHLASVPLIKKPKLVENNPPIKMSQLASGSQGSSLFMDGSVNGSLSRPSLKETVAYQTPLVQLFGRDIANNVRINVDLGHIAPRDIPLPMETMVLPKSIDGHRLPSVSRKSDYSPEILVTMPIENLLVAKKLHASIRYRLPSTVSAADCAMGVFYYIRSELFPDRPPNWKIGPLVYASDQGKPAKLCFDFSHHMALKMEGVVAIAVLFTPTGNHASDALRYDIPDKRMQTAGRQNTDFF